MAKTSKWDEIIKGIFSKKDTFFSGTELADLLCNTHNISQVNARQIIKRSAAKGLIKTSSPFKFQNGQFVYMGIKDNLNLNVLMKISKKYKQSLYRLLWLLNEENKVISLYEARKIMAVPVKNVEKYKLVDFDDEIKELIKNDIIAVKQDLERGIKYLVAKELEDDSWINSKMNLHFEKMALDTLFVPDIIRWLRSHNFIDSNEVIYRRKDNPSIGASHNDFLWDAYAYTNTTGFSINVGKKDKQTLVVLDIVTHRTYSKQDLSGFYNRIQSVRHSTHGEARKILPIIFFNEIDLEVKKEINNLKLLNFSIQDIFGVKVTDLINKLDDISKTLNDQFLSIEERTKSIIDNAEHSLNLIKDTGHTDNLQNLKGHLFESLMYVVVLNLFPHNSRITHSSMIKPYEYDIIVQRDDEVIVIELKGLKNKTIINLGDSNTNNTIRWFFAKTFPHAKQAYTSPNSPFKLDKSKIKACYITSGNFSDEAKIKLENLNKTSIKPKDIDCYYDRKGLLKLLKNHEHLSSLRKSTNFIDLLEQHYLKQE